MLPWSGYYSLNCIPLLYLESRDCPLRLANLGGNVEVWLPQGTELPALQYPCLEISPDLGAESGEGSVALMKLSLLGFLDRWASMQAVVARERVVFGLVGCTADSLSGCTTDRDL